MNYREPSPSPSHRQGEQPAGSLPKTSVEELQARLTELQQIGQIGSWWYEPETGNTWWSEETYRLFGLAAQDTLPTFEMFLQRVHPQDRLYLEQVFQKALQFREPHRIEFRVVRPDGVTLWIESRGFPKFHADGRLWRIEGTNQDLTLRKQRELEQGEREAQIRNAFDHMLEGLQIVGFDLRLQYMNQVAERQAGRSKTLLVGKTFGEIYPDLVHSEFERAIQTCLTQRVAITMRSQLQFASGTLATYEVSIQPSPHGTLILTQDVSEQELMEQQLRVVEDELAAFFRTSNVGMSVWGFDGKPIRVNATCCRLLGYSQEEFLELKLPEIIATEDQEDSQHLLGKLRAGEITHYQTQRRYVRRDGSSLYTHVYVAIIRYAAGLPASFAVVLIDQTSQVALEERYRQAQKMEALGRFAGGVAHDFNNLLSVITIAADLLSPSPLPDEAKHTHLQAIRQAAERGSRLTHQLLAFSRKQQLRPVLLDINDRVQESKFLLDRVLGNAIHLDVSLSPDVRWIKIDPTQFEQILLNLVINARDAVPEVGGQIKVTTCFEPNYDWGDQAALGMQAKGAMCLRIVDNGPGISRQILPRIFEPFFTTKGSEKGNGLGLAIVHSAIEQCAGKIEVVSEPSQGTHFSVYFPIY